MTGHGRSDDQAASSLLSEVKADGSSAIEGSVQVSLDDFVPCLHGAVQDTRISGTTSIGDEDIDFAKVFDDISDQLLDVLVVANIALVWLGLDAVLLLQLLGVLLTTLLAGRVGDGNISTHFSTSSRSFSTDSGGTRSTRYDNDFAL